VFLITLGVGENCIYMLERIILCFEVMFSYDLFYGKKGFDFKNELMKLRNDLKPS
jgi:hypothetical protein